MPDQIIIGHIHLTSGKVITGPFKNLYFEGTGSGLTKLKWETDGTWSLDWINVDQIAAITSEPYRVPN